MYSYEWYQWLAFFYIYCFFGWIFESAYVSFLKKRFVNRGFLHLPLLPLYGTGAVMMLWVSLPVKDNLFLVYAAGVIAATSLEYVTEKLFKVKYWDYSDQRFQLNGYICLSSSIAWGFLTILLTEVIHRPIEAYVLGLPTGISLSCVCAASVLFAADTVRSVKEALDFAKMLDAMTRMRAEFDDAQVQLALLKAEMRDRAVQARDESRLRMELLRSETTARTAALKDEAAARTAALKDEAAARTTALKDEAAARTAALSRRLEEIRQWRQDLTGKVSFYRRGILQRNPSASSPRFARAFEELRELAERKH